MVYTTSYQQVAQGLIHGLIPHHWGRNITIEQIKPVCLCCRSPPCSRSSFHDQTSAQVWKPAAPDQSHAVGVGGGCLRTLVYRDITTCCVETSFLWWGSKCFPKQWEKADFILKLIIVSWWLNYFGVVKCLLFCNYFVWGGLESSFFFNNLCVYAVTVEVLILSHWIMQHFYMFPKFIMCLNVTLKLWIKSLVMVKMWRFHLSYCCKVCLSNMIIRIYKNLWS